MGRKTKFKQLYCYMNGVLVGELTLQSGQLSFQYDSSWLNFPKSRPISLSMPLQTAEHKGDVVAAYFDNLLPDSSQIRQQIVNRLGAQNTSPFELLSTIAADCVGALSLSKTPDIASQNQLKLIPLNDENIADTLRQARTGNFGMQKDEDFRISIAGVQEKTALTYWQGQWYKPLGTTPTTHILKLPIQPYLETSVENEWFCLRFLSHLGFKVPEIAIKTFIDQKVLTITRFDRKLTDNNIVRLPQEDMCQALGVFSGRKYQNDGGPGITDMMGILKTSINALADQHTFMRSQVVYWLLAAIDGHAKNFSIFLQPQGFSLSPIYDVISVYPYLGKGNIPPKQKIKMALAVYGEKKAHYKWAEILRRHWITTAQKVDFAVDEMEMILNDLVEQVPIAIESTLAELPDGFPANISDSIANGITRCLKKLNDQT
ncbi:MAG: type II toxin-antitoxin system HipA family toxin [Candidatus Parabeggiatoa sp. nov. 3]|nr:MAG: type II toxin-antitoxin system HipA family toxin [Gammaproteobacteria bacterium]RKZ85230.1 MAG: type II toxin-antitoxin system HipA family toxin [Gammaproteobacteria bacterium]HEW98413.1 type II toxin-antitoxin system HipA family toxin [Beggiatoa sp.]